MWFWSGLSFRVFLIIYVTFLPHLVKEITAMIVCGWAVGHGVEVLAPFAGVIWGGISDRFCCSRGAALA